MRLDHQHIALRYRAALHQRPAIDDLAQPKAPSALLSAEGRPGHAQDQAIDDLLTPQPRAPGAAVTAADGAGVKATATTALAGAALTHGAAVLAVLGDQQ